METFIAVPAMLTILTDIAGQHGALLMWFTKGTATAIYFTVQKSLYLKTIRN